jgi:precorrin-6B methylase 1
VSKPVTGAPGSLACVGLGMMLGGHLAPRARDHIERADVVFVVASDSVVELWIRRMRPDARSLQDRYAEGKSRHRTYREMVEAILAEVKAGRRVCAAFYGHPGVFAKVPHEAIARARAEGCEAVMEPAVSAEDCLYADLGIDPGRVGCQHYEASQLLLHHRRLDPSAYLVLWQVGVVGDRSCTRFETGPRYRELLVERLRLDYPAGHRVTVYEAATLPVMSPLIMQLPLEALPSAHIRMHSTLVIPPCESLRRNEAMISRLAALDRELAAEPRPPRKLSLVKS